MYSCLHEYRKLHSPWTSKARFSLSSEDSSVLIAFTSKECFLLNYAISETPQPTKWCEGRRQNWLWCLRTPLAYGYACWRACWATRQLSGTDSLGRVHQCSMAAQENVPRASSQVLQQATNSIKKEASYGHLYWGTGNCSWLNKLLPRRETEIGTNGTILTNFPFFGKVNSTPKWRNK